MFLIWYGHNKSPSVKTKGICASGHLRKLCAHLVITKLKGNLNNQGCKEYNVER